jgi:hypothetical protein
MKREEFEMEKIESKLRELFCELNRNPNTDWSYAADLFITWTIKKNFKTESFEAFVDYMSDESEKVFGNETWGFFFGYGDDFESFANDWVADEEKVDYLKYCENIANK